MYPVPWPGQAGPVFRLDPNYHIGPQLNYFCFHYFKLVCRVEMQKVSNLVLTVALTV